MIEKDGDIWENKDHKIITTNLRGVMGRGLAFQAKQKFPGLEGRYKSFLVARNKNDDLLFIRRIKSGNTYYKLILLPVKHHWKSLASMDLIIKSLLELKTLSEKFKKSCAIPPIGAGYGGLDWKKDVKPVVEDILDITNKFYIIYPTGMVFNRYKNSFKPSSSKKINEAMKKNGRKKYR